MQHPRKRRVSEAAAAMARRLDCRPIARLPPLRTLAGQIGVSLVTAGKAVRLCAKQNLPLVISGGGVFARAAGAPGGAMAVTLMLTLRERRRAVPVFEESDRVMTFGGGCTGQVVVHPVGINALCGEHRGRAPARHGHRQVPCLGFRGAGSWVTAPIR